MSCRRLDENCLSGAGGVFCRPEWDGFLHPVSNVGMDTSWRASRITRLELMTAVLFLFTALSIACMLLVNPGRPGPGRLAGLVQIAVEASPLVFFCAGVLVLLKRGLGYGVGLAAGLMALPWFVWRECSLAPHSSWVSLMNPDFRRSFPTEVELRILSAALVGIAIACASLRLLPPQWSLRGIPLHRRTWPAFAVGFLGLAAWFISAAPYREALFDRLAPAQLRILHVVKRGLHIHETAIFEFGDGRVWVWRDDRRLFQYRFELRSDSIALAEMSQTAFERARTLVESPELWELRTRPPRVPRSWNAEGWFVVLQDSKLVAFTTEYGTMPPREVADLFYEIERLPVSYGLSFFLRDVCLGFCYDPVAALGFSRFSAARVQ